MIELWTTTIQPRSEVPLGGWRDLILGRKVTTMVPRPAAALVCVLLSAAWVCKALLRALIISL
jgi:hypothetical protein